MSLLEIIMRILDIHDNSLKFKHLYVKEYRSQAVFIKQVSAADKTLDRMAEMYSSVSIDESSLVRFFISSHIPKVSIYMLLGFWITSRQNSP